MISIVFTNRQNSCDSLIRVERQQIDHRPTLGGTTGLGDIKHPQPVNLTLVGKTQDGVVRTGDHQMLNKVFIFQ